MPVATEIRPEITVTAFHRFVRWLYRLIFGTILLGIITGIIQGFVMSGNFQVPSNDDLQHIWYVRGFVEQPWLYAPITLLLAALGIGGFIIDRRLDAADASAQQRETAAIASTAAKQHVDAAMPTFHEAIQETLSTHGQQVQATITNLLGQLPKTAAPTSYGVPFDDGSLHRPTPFVGRGDELAWLMTRLRSSTPTVMAVGGMGGIGKTGLVAEAIARAHQRDLFPDGIAVILCRERDDALGILRDVLTRFDPQRQSPQAQDLVGLTDSARAMLHGKRVAVVLDNIEPEVAIRDIVQPLRDVGATVIITARHELPLDVCTMDNQRRLDILAPSEALALFEQVYLREGRAMNDVLRAAAQRIVATLGYHTYGIRLISAYAGDVRPDLDRLANELDRDPTFALGIKNVDASEFLGAVFARSIDALTSEAQSLALALGLVPANTIGRLATLALAAGIGLSDRDADQALTLLSRRVVIIINEDQPAQESDSVRVQLHPLMYAYLQQRGHEQLPPVQQVAALDALEAFFARYAITAPDAARAVDEAVSHALIERAHSLSHTDHLVDLCYGMCIYWRDRSRIQAALRYLPWAIYAAQHQVEQSEDQAVRRRRANLTGILGDIYADTGQIDTAEQMYRADLTERQALHDRKGEGAALTSLGQIAQSRGRLDEAITYFHQALIITREVQDRQGEGVALSSLGQVAQSRGQLDEATAYFQQALVIFREVQGRRNEGAVFSSLGQIAQSRGQLSEATAYFQQALVILHEVQDHQNEGVVLLSLGQVAQSRGQLDEATAYFQQALVILREVQDRQNEGMVLSSMGLLLEKKGEMAQAEQAHRDSLAIALELGIAPDIAPSQEELAAFLMRHAPERSQREACQLLAQAQSIYHELGQTDDADRVAQRIRAHGC